MALFKIVERDSFLQADFFIPESANALSLEAARELGAVVRKYKSWRRPVVVSSVHPSVFCSGGNLSDYARLKGREPGLRVNREITKHLDAFAAWPVVKLAVVEGDVLGGGMEWLARFDFRWSVPNAFFAFWQRRIGLSSGWGGGRVWAARVGEARVRQLLLEGRLLSAGEALRLGLVDRVVSSWKIREEAERWAAGLSGGAVGALTGWKAASESKVFSSLWMGSEHKAVLDQWKGRAAKKKRNV